MDEEGGDEQCLRAIWVCEFGCWGLKEKKKRKKKRSFGFGEFGYWGLKEKNNNNK